MMLLVSLLFAFAMGGTQPRPPALVVDGNLDDQIWRTLIPEKLTPSEPGVPAELGGEVRATISGRYLLMAARLPEPSGRITARMTGRNPNWEDEDLLRVVAGPDIGYTDRDVKINPLGAYSVEREGKLVHPGADQYLVATHIGDKEWTAELALPLNLLSAPGPDRILISVERIRAARPGVPQQRWKYPRYGPVAKVSITSRDWDAPAPEFRPNMAGGATLQIPRVKQTPALESAWDDTAWAGAPGWTLFRNEPNGRVPRFPTEVKAIHDSQTLSVIAKCRERVGMAGRQDSFGIYLATSGSAYAHVAVDPFGSRHDEIGLAGGPRISRGREWKSSVRSFVRELPDGWQARIDIPLQQVAEVLGETSVPENWRLLLMRSRPAREGEPLEVSVLPAVETDVPVCPARYARVRLAGESVQSVTRPEMAEFDTDVFSAAERKKLDLAGMVDRHLRGRIQKIVDEEERAWTQIRTREDWEAFRGPRIKALAASLGPFPERIPLETRVTNTFSGPGYTRQNLVFRSRADLWVTANLYLPEKPAGRMPGIVIIHSHHSSKSQSEVQDMGILWARVGCAVLVIDQIGHGERLQNYPWNREHYHSRYMMGMELYAAGESLVKWMVWDVMRAVDLLLERKDVNPEQIILLGAVAGGGDPAAVAAALDPRIAAVAPFNFGRLSPGWGEWESTRCLRRSIVDRFFPWVIDASVAPRRLVYAMEMGWENYRTHESWERFQKVFAFYGAPDRLDEAHGFGTFPGPGECNNIGPAQRKTLYPELNRWFGIPIPPEEPQDRRPEAELMALTPVIASELQMKPIQQLAREVAVSRLTAARRELASMAPAERRDLLEKRWQEKLGDIAPNPRPQAVQRWVKDWRGAAVEGISLETEPGIILPLLLFKPHNGAARMPAVIGVSQGGKDRIVQLRRREIEALLRNGIAVCLPDVRGTGETTADPRRGLSAEEDSQAATEFMLGNTLLGARLKDLRTVLAYVRSRQDLDQNRIALWGDTYAPPNPGRLLLDEVPGWQIGPEIQHQAEPLGALLAVLGALYEEGVRAVATRGGLVDYLAMLDDNFTYVPNDVIVPGILHVSDISDVVKALAPRPVLMQAVVDGRNRLVRDAAPDTDLADWLVTQLR